MILNNPLPTRRTVEKTIHQGFKWILVLSNSRALYRLLERGGYSEEVHNHGWALLGALCLTHAPWSYDSEISPHSEAVVQLRGWYRESSRRIRAALNHHFPPQCGFVLDELPDPGEVSIVLVVEALLNNLDALAEGSDPDREAMREEDRAAIALLESRFIIDDDMRANLRGLIAEAKKHAEMPDDAVSEEVYAEMYYAFHAWLEDWGSTARALTGNKRILARLGLYKPRRKKQSEDAEATEVAEVSAPAASTGDGPAGGSAAGAGSANSGGRCVGSGPVTDGGSDASG